MGQQHTQIAGPVSIVDGDAAFYKDIQQLCDERYGTGYLHRDDFVHWLERTRLLKIALLDGEFAGFAVMIQARVGLVMKKMDMPRADVLRISGEKPSLIYKSAVSYTHLDVYKRQGLESAALFAINLCIVFILWLGGNRIGAGFRKIGDITALTQYAVMILFYIIMAQMVFILIPRAMICVRRISAVLYHTPEIEDGPTAACALKTGLNEVVRFDHVSFRFADADEDTLGDLNFACKRGETTAIIGSTGSGKSTIAKLILRFHDVTSGSILFNGCDIHGMPQAELRERIAYVPQKAWLFSGTIADNLRYGDRNADKKQMEHALRTAQAGFVSSLPDGLYEMCIRDRDTQDKPRRRGAHVPYIGRKKTDSDTHKDHNQDQS